MQAHLTRRLEGMLSLESRFSALCQHPFAFMYATKCIAPVKMKIAYSVAETQVLRLAAIASLMVTLRARRLRSSAIDTTFTSSAS